MCRPRIRAKKALASSQFWMKRLSVISRWTAEAGTAYLARSSCRQVSYSVSPSCPRRVVDGDGRRGKARIPPRADLADCHLRGHAADRADPAILLGNRDEDIGAHGPVLHPDQGLKPDELPGLRVHLGLVDHVEAIVLDRGEDPGPCVFRLQLLLPHLLCKEQAPVLAAALDPCHRGLGAEDDILRRLAPLGVGGADAGKEPPPVHAALSDGLEHLVDVGKKRILLPDLVSRDPDQELIPAVARELPAVAGRDRGKLSRDLPKEPVSLPVAVGLVDLLEAVHVREDQGVGLLCGGLFPKPGERFLAGQSPGQAVVFPGDAKLLRALSKRLLGSSPSSHLQLRAHDDEKEPAEDQNRRGGESHRIC
jgi:hypothetical protein